MASRRPQDVIFTLFGDYLLHRGKPVWVGSLIALLRPLGLSEGAVRTTLSRMAAKGWLSSERHGRHGFYHLTVDGRRLLEEGESRIYFPAWDAPWDGTWRIVTYSIPEDNRHLRDRLRIRLSWLGFGSPGMGLWISPHDVVDRVAGIAISLGLCDHMEIFEGSHFGFSSQKRLVDRCWDLASINARYLEFIETYLPEFELSVKAIDTDSIAPEDAFVRRFDLVHVYREFPLIDPFLPRSLLPDDWAGDCAAGLFRAMHDLLAEPADRYLDEVLAAGAANGGIRPAADAKTERIPVSPLSLRLIEGARAALERDAEPPVSITSSTAPN